MNAPRIASHPSGTPRSTPARILCGLLFLSLGLTVGEPIAQAANPSDMVDLTFRVTVPENTPASDSIYIAGDFQGWDPGSETHRLTSVGENVHELTLSFEAPLEIQFKFTRGSWGQVEKGPSGEEIPNRMLNVVESATASYTVSNWADLPAGGTITGDVEMRLVPSLFGGRRVWVYLPPGYHDAPQERYPVLYMLDGQNVFDAATSFSGEWQVDESCEELISGGRVRPLIVVAVANGESNRIDEYTPWYDEGRGAGGGGGAHVTAIIEVLKPLIDLTYRTLPDRDNTGFAGSSLGGLMAMYVAYAHGDVFGRIGSFSPSISWADFELLNFVSLIPRPASKVYVDMGTLESGTMVDDDLNGVDDHIDALRALRDIMVEQGFTLGNDLVVVEDEGGIHHESAWAARFPAALEYLFPAVGVSNESTNLGGLKARFRRN